MPNNKITVTSVSGAGQAITSKVFNYVEQLVFDFKYQTLTIVNGSGVKAIVALSPPVATVIYTISNDVATVAVS